MVKSNEEYGESALNFVKKSVGMRNNAGFVVY